MTDETTSTTGSDAATPAPPEQRASVPTQQEVGAEVAPPSRRSAIIRSGFIVAVLLIVFVVILPQYVSYKDVIEAFAALTPIEILTITILGILAWVMSGAIFAALIQRLNIIRGTESWLILAGIGASVPLGPWNMGVLWVVVRGWNIANVAATSGIALYGIVNILSRLALPVIAVGALIITDGVPQGADLGTAWTIALIAIIAFFVAIGLMSAIVRSERVADWIGSKSQTIVSWLMKRLGRTPPDVDRAVHHFRDQLGEVIRRRGAASIAIAVVSQVVWVIVLTAALRMTGVPDSALSSGQIFAVYALVMVITILPISPGGAGVPELLFISAFTNIAGEQYNAAITAGVFLYRLYFWFVPIPIAWILLKTARRGKPMLPSSAELKAYAKG